MVNATTKEGVPVENANPSDEPTVLCIIKDETTSDWKNSKHTINLPASTPVQELITHAAKEAKYVEDSFLLVWSKPQGNEEILLNAYKDKTLQEVGLVSNGKKNSFLIKDKDGVQPTKNKVCVAFIASLLCRLLNFFGCRSSVSGSMKSQGLVQIKFYLIFLVSILCK